MSENFYKKLMALGSSNRYPFHMPGHKRNLPDEAGFLRDIAGADITEIDGFDDLAAPEGVISDEQRRAARIFGAGETFFLVGGSTLGILSSICAQTEYGGMIIMDRMSHKSAYNAVYLNGLSVKYLYPSSWLGSVHAGITPESVALAMDETGVKTVFVTSPTYDGIVSDIEGIAKEVHKRGGILIVDEAHGAHLSLMAGCRHEEICTEKNIEFPESAVKKGADIVIQSLHKTLPALTQTALLHICSERIDPSAVKQKINIFQTSSPSYILMASISYCLHFTENEAKEAAEGYIKRLSGFYERCGRLKNLKLLTWEMASDMGAYAFDPGKLAIFTTGCEREGRAYNGTALKDELLKSYGLDLEMAADDHALAMTSVMDTDDGFMRLENALSEIDETLERSSKADPEAAMTGMGSGSVTGKITGLKPGTGGGMIRVMTQPGDNTLHTIREAMDSGSELVPIKDAAGKVAAQFVYVYPPGIPVIVPGERI